MVFVVVVVAVTPCIVAFVVESHLMYCYDAFLLVPEDVFYFLPSNVECVSLDQSTHTSRPMGGVARA